MPPFRALDGGLSQPHIIYREIRDHPSNVVIPYQQIPLGYEKATRVKEKVSKLFEREQQRHVVCVKGEGWMIVSGVRQVEEALRRQRHVTRHQGRVLQIAETADRREMSGEERLRADAVLIAAKSAYGMLRGLAARRVGVEDVKVWEQQRANGQ